MPLDLRVWLSENKLTTCREVGKLVDGYVFNACAARVTVVGLSVCLSVCVCVETYSGTTGYKAAN